MLAELLGCKACVIPAPPKRSSGNNRKGTARQHLEESVVQYIYL